MSNLFSSPPVSAFGSDVDANPFPVFGSSLPLGFGFISNKVCSGQDLFGSKCTEQVSAFSHSDFCTKHQLQNENTQLRTERDSLKNSLQKSASEVKELKLKLYQLKSEHKRQLRLDQKRQERLVTISIPVQSYSAVHSRFIPDAVSDPLVRIDANAAVPATVLATVPATVLATLPTERSQ